MLPDWDELLSAASRLQQVLPGAVLVGGTASAIHASHRFSRDADHVLTDLRARFNEVLGDLESVAGWKTARVRRPVLVLGSLDGIETGVRQLIRQEPLETVVLETAGGPITVPSHAEILRIKGVLALKRNATRDYVDFAALAHALGHDRAAAALERFDDLYPQESGESSLQQLIVQLASPEPFDLDAQTLPEYKGLKKRWHLWADVKAECAAVARTTFDHVCETQQALRKRSRLRMK